MKGKVNPQDIWMRAVMFEMFSEKDLSSKALEKISQAFGCIPEENKEKLAAKMVEMMKANKTEEELIVAAENIAKNTLH